MNKQMQVLACLCVFLCAQSVFAAGTVRRFVLVAGANYGGADRVPLRYAVSDAEKFARVLESMGGVNTSDRILLEEPALQTFHKALESVRAKVLSSPKGSGRTEVILYYSGHADESGLLLGNERLSYRSLRNRMDAIEADVHITVLDACASGAITRLKGGQRQKAFLVDASSDMKGYAFLTSSSEDEAAQESDRIQASFFTHYLLSGMRGAADMSGDGKVTLGEAYQFAFHKTLARTTETQAGAQHPAYDIKMAGTGDVVMTDIRRASAGLVLDKRFNGRFFIRNADQQLVAELYKAAGREVELGLEPGTYSIHFEESPRLFYTSLKLEEGERRVLEKAHLQAVTREQAAHRGGVQAGVYDTVDVSASGYRFSFGALLNRQREPFRGIQFSIFVNRANEDAGTQFSVIANWGYKHLKGTQISGVANYAGGRVDYGQFAGVFNRSRDRVTGAQVAGALNIAGGVKGAQAGALNVAGGVGGVQVGALNVAREVEGVQVGASNTAGGIEGAQAGALNVAGGVGGVQVGALNIAGKVKGVQLGVVNISEDIEGTAIGVFTYSQTGLFNFSIWRDETGLNYVTLMSGSRHFYTSYSFGYNPTADARPFALGLGMGGHLQRHRLYLDLDANYYYVFAGFGDDHKKNQLARLRLLGGARLNSRFSAFAGVSFNLLWVVGDGSLISPWGGYERSAGSEYFVWPGFFAGIRMSR